MEFSNEQLWIGNIGHSAIIVALVTALFSCVAYVCSARMEDDSSFWERAGRYLFYAHALFVMVAVAALLHILYYHLFEYYYAYQHSSSNLPLKYILSCLWEGQEGSFLLWILWNAFLALLFIYWERPWETMVMPFVGVVQCCLLFLLLGVYIGSWKLGSNPFALLRNEWDAPLFRNPDYLSLLKDGRGLNALLQNYWMVIHPPLLFLGFAATLLPFSLVMGGLWQGNFSAWTPALLRWGIGAAGILGLGIMLGAVWAYESLTFGGYWAWDPVENASLVPWLLLVAAIHTNLVYIKVKKYLRLTCLLYLLAFLSVLYATYLTRSGVLGDTSVHSFTDLGMNTLLLSFLLGFVVFSLGAYGYKYPLMASEATQEEGFFSRELYLFLGSITLLLSAFLISVKTSLPVINKVLGTHFAPPEEVEFSFNSHQIFVAFLLALLSGVSLLMQYKQTNKSVFLRKLLHYLLITLVLSGIFLYFFPIYFNKYGVMFEWIIRIAYVCTCFMLMVNASLLLGGIKLWSWKRQGAFITHTGFALLLMGILLSASGKRVLSLNTSGFSPLAAGDAESPLENLTLIRGIPVSMGDYELTYLNDSIAASEGKVFYNIRFYNKISKKTFVLHPDVISNTKGMEGVSPNPDAWHEIGGDIFAYLTYLSDKQDSEQGEPKKDFVTLKVYAFPFIGLLWLGGIIMTIGFGWSFYARLRLNKAIT